MKTLIRRRISSGNSVFPDFVRENNVSQYFFVFSSDIRFMSETFWVLSFEREYCINYFIDVKRDICQSLKVSKKDNRNRRYN